LVNQHEDGAKSTKDPRPNLRSSPGNTSGRGADRAGSGRVARGAN
jgi:hypothetical protein